MPENTYDPAHSKQSDTLYERWEALRALGVEANAVVAPEGWLGEHTSWWYSLPIIRVPVKGAYRDDVTGPYLAFSA